MTTQPEQLAEMSPERKRGLEMLVGQRRGDDVLAYRLAAQLEKAGERVKGHAA
jgi:hypothetical protein